MIRGLPIAIFLLSAICSPPLNAQYLFEGKVGPAFEEGTVYLSLVEDYRKLSGVYHEQIIAKTRPDSQGYFMFAGTNLPSENKIYRIHADICEDTDQNVAHITGHCPNSEEILFVANNTTTLELPFGFEQEMFCKIVTRDRSAGTFLKIDSLKNDMRYAFMEYRSEANRKVNTQKWFGILQEYGAQLNEPLAELYIYSFISDRKSMLHSYYLTDLRNNEYYDQLLERLQTAYPEAPYTKQFEAELRSDRFLISEADITTSLPWWVYLLGGVCLLSILGNAYLFRRKNTQRLSQQQARERLSDQEEKVLQLILNNKTNKEIAGEIFVSVSTVKTHINNLYKKLGVRNRSEVKQRFQT
ncbi:helix-turn-helix transcriptional regulator [Altibacter sp. HG106]|uniref:helix-turn-helix transcriptional regulator n=1 Tax=Altibacter sp. HG106 TaxID=3023937 RepID=UPI00234FCA08|nr:helix-turn-helix transcriptional regulator [Altibacter sp. HG106]MDC7995911.1 helix-turn-helix transcriptional regulator [Altibacter sp. HG106]